MDEKTTGIYIHIPFCVRKCNYCAFLSSAADEATKEEYVQALINEIGRCRFNFACEAPISTLYFGGGTPTVLSTEQIGRVMGAIRDNFALKEDAEITIEANPGTLGKTDDDIKTSLQTYKELGFNRLSMGVQSLNDDVLKLIGRIHAADDVVRDYRIAREMGWDNINLDLILSLPIEKSQEQSLEDLDELIKMGPEHISCYSLQIEEGTPFGKMYDEGRLNEVSDEDDRETYHKVCEILKAAGYEHYEISNFARSSYRSRHNSSYWNMSDYIGLGLGASGFVNGVRYRNIADIKKYIDTFSEKASGVRAPESYEEYHRNTQHDNISEAVFTGLRRIEGISYDEAAGHLDPEDCDAALSAKERFWQYYSDVKREAESFVSSGHLVIDDDGIRLSEKGIDISNSIMALFV